MEMRDRLIELIINAPKLDCIKGGRANGKTYQTVQNIADYLLANGVIVPPCNVGDMVYYVSFGNVYKGKCHAITLKPTLQIHLYDFDGDNASYPASKVFLTKEEAEKALKEREGNG